MFNKINASQQDISVTQSLSSAFAQKSKHDSDRLPRSENMAANFQYGTRQLVKWSNIIDNK
jgi:hypothetical protein